MYAVVLLIYVSAGAGLRAYAPSNADPGMCQADGHGGFTVCTSEEHSRYLEPLNATYESFRATSKELGVQSAVPATVVEDYTPFSDGTAGPSLRISASVAGWTTDSESLAVPDPDVSWGSFADAMAYPSHCPQLRGDDPPSAGLQKTMTRTRSDVITMVSQDRPADERQAAARDFAKNRSALAQCRAS
ncbi:hypothetical protein ASQ49_04895 [Acidipropionibacterium acidipropionici]|nr:hypothetical protein ASQ49_04895 [Acidipropionibacterium acidipropionici]APZ09519.1 hypothetical protein BWX38_10030 [Acidipropionibacterium acidipropionici]